MKISDKIIHSQEIKGIADYISIYKNTIHQIKVDGSSSKKQLKVSLLSSFTTTGIKETLSIKCSQLNIMLKFYSSDYNRYAQEIINADSGLYKFCPDLIIIFIDTQTIMGEYFFLPYKISDEERRALIEGKLEEIKLLIRMAKERSSAKILLHNFQVPIYSPLGILESKQNFGFIEAIEALNNNLRDIFKNDSRVFVFDYDAFCSRIGKDNIIDHKMYYLGDIKLNLQYIPDLCCEYVSYIKPLMSMTKKCIVLDLDNTLWGGVIGEDGIDKINLGPTPEGRPYLEFQKHLFALFNRGIMLAINSKNNLSDALEVLRKHPDMILKEEHFASMKINWDDKVSNMAAIAKELNIGLDSLVFIDDDKFNRQMIKDALPEILTIDLPDDPALYSKVLTELNDFNTLQITKEDRDKNQMYLEQRKREDFKTTAGNIDEYLRGLEMAVTIQRVNSFTIPRISQLTQKTNQFNMTTRRYLEENIKKFFQDHKFLVISVKVEDKFGDNGIVGTAIVKKEKTCWVIDTFLLSCRVIGRDIEKVLLEYIIEKARGSRVKKLIGEFIMTEKNTPAKEFYRNSGFELIKKDRNVERWEYSITRKGKYPNFIKVIKG